MVKHKKKVFEGDKNLPLDKMSLMQIMAMHMTKLRKHKNAGEDGVGRMSLPEKQLSLIGLRVATAYYNELYGEGTETAEEGDEE